MCRRPTGVAILGGLLLVAAGCASSRPPARPVVQTPPPRLVVQAPPPMPAAPAEARTAQPGPNYVWIPGYYDWRPADRTYVWLPGKWIVAPDGQTWVPGHWETRRDGSRWVGGHWQATVQAVQTQPPPPMPAPPAEVRMAQPGAHYIWIPGHYEWRATDRTYVWVPGNWSVPPAGYTWVPGRWESRPEGNVWIQSHWQRT
jgi:hypothetical protein